LKIVVEDRMLVLSLNRKYRRLMKEFERGTLLRYVRTVASTLGTTGSPGPVEGYYVEDTELTEYFHLMRALQEAPASDEAVVGGLDGYRRLLQVVSSPIFGRPIHGDRLLPKGRNPLGWALLETRPDWTIPGLTAAARRAALREDDISLVGIGARTGDAVVLAALSESVVLYTEVMTLGALEPATSQWAVSPEIEDAANRFITAFNELTGASIPDARRENAEAFVLSAVDIHQLAGQCVRLGTDESGANHYHWAICRQSGVTLEVHEFWSDTLWTSERYRAERTHGGRCR